MYFGGVIMKKYLVPEIELVALSAEDILNNSDTLVDIGDLYLYGEGSPEVVISEYTGEPIEQ